MHTARVEAAAPDAVLPKPEGGAFCDHEQQARFVFVWAGKKPFKRTRSGDLRVARDKEIQNWASVSLVHEQG